MSEQLSAEERDALNWAVHTNEACAHVVAAVERILAARLADVNARLAAVEVGRDKWQDKWKRRGQTIEDLKVERDQYRRESAEHLALMDGKTAISLVTTAALHPDPSEATDA